MSEISIEGFIFCHWRWLYSISNKNLVGISIYVHLCSMGDIPYISIIYIHIYGIIIYNIYIYIISIYSIFAIFEGFRSHIYIYPLYIPFYIHLYIHLIPFIYHYELWWENHLQVGVQHGNFCPKSQRKSRGGRRRYRFSCSSPGGT